MTMITNPFDARIQAIFLKGHLKLVAAGMTPPRTYKHGANEDDFSRWFIAAKSDATFGSFELGDTYARDVLNYGLLVAATPEWLEQYRQKSTIHPDHRVTALD